MSWALHCGIRAIVVTLALELVTTVGNALRGWTRCFWVRAI